jgi:hypothetical protein
VEVALIIALIATVAIGALSFVGSSSGSSLDEAGKGIDDKATDASDPGSGGSGGGTTGGGTTGGGTTGGSGGSGGSGGGSATTAPGATSTTTAVPTTTTSTTAAPTTTVPPTPASASLDNGRGVRNGSSRWDASADLAIEGPPGASLRGTVTVEITWHKAYGQTGTDTIEVPVDEHGRAVIESGPYARSGSSRITSVDYRVVGVDFDDDGAWDGTQPSITIPRP